MSDFHLLDGRPLGYPVREQNLLTNWHLSMLLLLRLISKGMPADLLLLWAEWTNLPVCPPSAVRNSRQVRNGFILGQGFPGKAPRLTVSTHDDDVFAFFSPLLLIT